MDGGSGFPCRLDAGGTPPSYSDQTAIKQEGDPMDAKLSEQIEAIIDALMLSHTRAEIVTRTMRKQRVYFGLEYDHPDSDIKQQIGGCAT